MDSAVSSVESAISSGTSSQDMAHELPEIPHGEDPQHLLYDVIEDGETKVSWRILDVPLTELGVAHFCTDSEALLRYRDTPFHLYIDSTAIPHPLPLELLDPLSQFNERLRWEDNYQDILLSTTVVVSSPFVAEDVSVMLGVPILERSHRDPNFSLPYVDIQDSSPSPFRSLEIAASYP
jgi:hypothetical protein